MAYDPSTPLPDQPPVYTYPQSTKPAPQTSKPPTSPSTPHQSPLLSTFLLAVHSAITLTISLINYIITITSNTLNKVIPPSTRSRLRTQATDFAQTYPILASFLAAQVLITVPPVLIFAVWASCIIAFAVTVGVVLGLIAAGVFVFFVVGTALLFVVPAVIGLFGIAVGAWAFGVGAWILTGAVRRWREQRAGSAGGDGVERVKEE